MTMPKFLLWFNSEVIVILSKDYHSGWDNFDGNIIWEECAVMRIVVVINMRVLIGSYYGGKLWIREIEKYSL